VSAIDWIVTDLDGTLLCGADAGEEDIETIRALAKRNIKTVLATGRHRNLVRPYLEQIGEENVICVITHNGACLTDAGMDRLIESRPLPEDTVDRFLSYVRPSPYRYSVQAAPRPCYSKNEERLRDIKSPYFRGGKEIFTCGGDYRWLEEDDSFRGVDVYLLSVSHVEKEKLGAFRDAFSDTQIVIYEREGGLFSAELTAKGCSKRGALERAARAFGLSPDRALVLGDSANDLEMVRQAKYAAVPQGSYLAARLPEREGLFITAPCGRNPLTRAAGHFRACLES